MNRSHRGWLVAAVGAGMVVAGVWLLVPDWRARLGIEPVAGSTAQAPDAPATAVSDAASGQAAAPARSDPATAPQTAAAPTTEAVAAAGTAGGDATLAAGTGTTAPATSDPVEIATNATGPAAAADAAEPGAQVALAPAGGGAAAPSEAPAASAPDIPAFDLVRVDAEGEAVIAGTARPGAEVELLIDGVVIASAVAGRDGSFVVLASLGRSDRARALQLRNAGDQAAAGVAEGAVEVVNAESVATGEDAAAATPAPDATTTVAAAPAEGAQEAEPATGLSAPVVILPSASASETPLLVAPDSGQVALLQPAATDVARVVLDRITYSTGGDAVAAGRARTGHAVRAYANAEFVADAPVSAAGDWQVTLPRAVAETAVLLRFDEVAASGEVTSRLETPFTYDDGAGTVATRQRRIVVQRGDNLWRIAEQHYGAGIRYSVIFSANSGLIRDADLIYPGQVFAIPELVAAE